MVNFLSALLHYISSCRCSSGSSVFITLVGGCIPQFSNFQLFFPCQQNGICNAEIWNPSLTQVNTTSIGLYTWVNWDAYMIVFTLIPNSWLRSTYHSSKLERGSEKSEIRAYFRPVFACKIVAVGTRCCIVNAIFESVRFNYVILWSFSIAFFGCKCFSSINWCLFCVNFPYLYHVVAISCRERGIYNTYRLFLG